MRFRTIAAPLGMTAALLAACVTTPLAQENAANSASQPQNQARSGEEIYNDKCIYCHDTRGWGTRILARRTPEGQAKLTDREALPAAFTAIVVRQGIGSMPGFTPTDLSDEEIAIVAEWLERGE